MELAAGQGFEVKIVTLPQGQDPADAPEGFAERLSGAESYLVYRVRLEIERAPDKQQAYVRVLEFLGKHEYSPEFEDARRLAGDLLDLPREAIARVLPARGTAPREAETTPRLLHDHRSSADRSSHRL